MGGAGGGAGGGVPAALVGAVLEAAVAAQPRAPAAAAPRVCTNWRRVGLVELMKKVLLRQRLVLGLGQKRQREQPCQQQQAHPLARAAKRLDVATEAGRDAA